jgi:monothiol glutaredoxin
MEACRHDAMQRYTAGMNASSSTQDLSPAEADERVRDGTLTIVDVRPPEERELAAIAVPYAVLEGGGLEELLARPKDTPLGFLCHHGGRSAQAAEHFRAHGFSSVYNIVGGIEAWALAVDPSVPRY